MKKRKKSCRFPGIHLTCHGYLRIHRGKLRNQYAHRAYMEKLIGRKLTASEHVHHDCKNPQCWPPTDFHLVLMDEALHVAQNGGRRKYAGRKRKH